MIRPVPHKSTILLLGQCHIKQPTIVVKRKGGGGTGKTRIGINCVIGTASVNDMQKTADSISTRN